MSDFRLTEFCLLFPPPLQGPKANNTTQHNTPQHDTRHTTQHNTTQDTTKQTPHDTKKVGRK